MTTMKFHRNDFLLLRIHKNDFLLQRIILLVAILASSLSAWAAPSSCKYATSGTGMGGTGARQENESSQMQPAGNVIFSRGTVEAQSKGRSRPLAKGAQVCVGETIATSESGMAQIRMLDTGFISVRPDTKMRIDAFQFNGKEDGTERSAFYLIRGAFRAVTGLIGHNNKENYKIETPTATIGIRGTDHEPMFIPDPVPGQVAPGEPGTYDKVNSGGVYIRSAIGSVEVKPNQVGFAPIGPSAPPMILKEIPHFYHAETGTETKGTETKGTETKSHSSESVGSNRTSRDAADRAPKIERAAKSENHAPTLQVPDAHTSRIHAHDVHAPESQAPDNNQNSAAQTSASQAPTSQTQTVQAPAVQAPAVQAPAVQAPAVQAPVMETQQQTQQN